MGSDDNSRKLWLLVSLILLIVPGVWNGFACLSNPCIHGVCLDDLNSTYFCYCIDGYTGIQCQTNWNECWSSPCQNGGVCIDGIAMFNCSCPPGFIGELCEEDINECESNPCQNNGTCLDVPNGYTCNCLIGYSGTHCEIDIAVCNATNETRCANGGFCEEGPGDSFSCRCQPGWGGFLCEYEIDECRSAPCQNGAICIDFHADYACACLFGFSGKNCEETVQVCDDNPCRNGALCLMEEGHSTCYCVPDFHGELCQFQYDECQLGPRCMNGGTCIDGIDNFTCSCPPKLTGVFCECLILSENKLDCTYVSPIPTTVTFVTTSSTTPFEISTFSSTATSTEFTTTTTYETTSLVPNITMTEPPKTTSTTVLSTTSTDFSTSTELSTISTLPITVTEILSSTSTEFFTTTTEFMTFPTSTVTTTEIIPETSTKPIEITFPPSTTPESTTLTTITDLVQSTTTIGSTTIESREGNATIPTHHEDRTATTSFPPDTISTLISTSSTTFPDITTLTSTVFLTESTTFPTIDTDCSLSKSRCQNGGTCILTDQGHECICPFDTEGTFCETQLGIRKAAFNGDSYLSHRLTNFSHVTFEFEAKTLSNSGLLFYSHIDETYMALYIENGYLKFKFSCGYQTMLLSEVKVPVNNGYSINIKAVLEFSKDLTHCDAVVKLNKTLTMMGDQTAKVNKFVNPVAWLHLGGLPQNFQNEISGTSGFIGCISELKINGKKTDIFKDAEDGFQVSECSSLACLSNPCRNSGDCISQGENWSCHCKNGFLGKVCDISICDNNPCLFGGTCIPFSSSGYLCLCPYGKHGHFCENDLKISEPYFSSSVRGLSSFVAYPIPDGITRNMEIQFRFTPTNMEQISILLFIGQNGHHDFYSDHLVVSFVKGYIMLTWNLGSGPRRIFTTQPIQKGARDYLVKLGNYGRRAWLYVENLGNVTGRSPGNLVQLDVVPMLYLGGYYSKNFLNLPHDLPLHSGFSGCIFDVEIKSGSVMIPLQGGRQTIGRAVGQCGTTECYEQSCQNEGACLHHGSTFMCLCQDSWYGPLCTATGNPCDESSTQCSEGSICVPQLSGYECDCPFGRTGKYCEKSENITDVSLTGRRSYIALASSEIENTRFNIEMQIRTLHDQGVVLFIGKKDSSFICLSLLNGLLELKIQSNRMKILSHNPMLIRSKKLLIKGIWHKIQFGLFGRKVYLSVDGVINTGLLNTGESVSVSREPIFIGGLPNLSELPYSATSSFPVSYTGCVRQFFIDTTHIPLIAHSTTIQSSRNVVDCDGTPCGKDICQHGGTCWLDSFMQPHCSCVQPYFGEYCQNIPICNETSCRNHGICSNSRCSCKIGWKGAFCETEITVKTPEFTGQSYLIIKKGNTDKKRNIRDLEILKIYLNFTTAHPNGLLVWSKNDRNFIGIGIENGYLKLTYSVGKSGKNYVEIPSYLQVSDGLWHAIEVVFSPFKISLDKKILEISKKSKENIVPSTNGVFYVGGISIPSNSTLLKETNGMFSTAFQGCIAGFGTNADVEINDFSQFDGRNVDVCDIF